jgi:hypothetical protein
MELTVRKKEKLEKGALLKEDGKYTVPEADEMIEKFSLQIKSQAEICEL